MSSYHNDLLAPYLALPQGDKIQAECTYYPYVSRCVISAAQQMFGSTGMAVFVPKPP
jgi:hypothetical protein